MSAPESPSSSDVHELTTSSLPSLVSCLSAWPPSSRLLRATINTFPLPFSTRTPLRTHPRLITIASRTTPSDRSLASSRTRTTTTQTTSSSTTPRPSRERSSGSGGSSGRRGEGTTAHPQSARSTRPPPAVGEGASSTLVVGGRAGQEGHRQPRQTRPSQEGATNQTTISTRSTRTGWEARPDSRASRSGRGVGSRSTHRRERARPQGERSLSTYVLCRSLGCSSSMLIQRCMLSRLTEGDPGQDASADGHLGQEPAPRPGRPRL